MSRLIHMEVEILYETSYTTVCGVTPTDTNATIDECKVTCTKCLKGMGIETLDRLHSRDQAANHAAQSIQSAQREQGAS